MNSLWTLKRLPASLLLLGMNIALAAIQLFSSIILARALGPDGRGVLAGWVVVSGSTASLALFGLHLVAGRMVSREPEQVRSIYKRSFKTVLIPVLLCSIALSAYYLVIDSMFQVEILLLSLLVLLGSVWNAIQVQVELVRGAYRTLVMARASFAVIHLFAISIIWFVFEAAAFSFFSAFAFATIVAPIVTYACIRHATTCAPEPWLTSVGPIKLLWRSKKDGIATIVSVLTNGLDKLLITFFFSAESLGFYVVAYAIAQIQSLCSEAIAPLFFGKMSTGDKLDTAWLELRLRQSIFVFVFSSLMTFAVAKPLLIFLFGEEYLAALPLVYLLVPALALKAIMRPFEEALKGLDASLYQSFANILWLAAFSAFATAGVLFNNLFVVAIALVLAGIVGVSVLAIMLRAKTNISLKSALIPHRSDFANLVGYAFGRRN